MLYYTSQSFLINVRGRRPYSTWHEKRPMDVSLKTYPRSKEVSIRDSKRFTIKFLKATVSDIVYFVLTDECNMFTTGTRDYIELVRSFHFATNETSKDFTLSNTDLHWTFIMAS